MFHVDDTFGKINFDLCYRFSLLLNTDLFIIYLWTRYKLIVLMLMRWI